MRKTHFVSLLLAACIVLTSRTLLPANQLVWSDWNTGQILLGSTTGGPASELYAARDFVTPLSDATPAGLAATNHYVYWANYRTGQLFRGTFDGNAFELFGETNTPPVLFPGEPRFFEGVAIDSDSVYWLEQVRDHIVKGPIDGGNSAANLFGAYDPNAVFFGHGVAVDNTYLYWPDSFTDLILRARKDGAGEIDTLFGVADSPAPSSDGTPVGIAVDDYFVYWTDVENSRVMRGAIDGSGIAEIMYDRSDYPGAPNDATPVGIAVDGNFVYWTDTSTGQILRGILSGTGPVEVLYDRSKYPGNPQGVYPQWLAIVPNAVPEPTTLSFAVVSMLFWTWSSPSLWRDRLG